MLKVGDKAPSFTLPDSTGAPVSLRSLLREGVVVLYFYPKDDTPGCTKEACAFRDERSIFKRVGAEIVGVSCDTTASHAKFAAKHRLPFPLLADADRTVVEKYGVYQEKIMYGRRTKGIVRTTFVIDRSGVIRALFPKVKVDGHSTEVLEAVKSLQ